MFVPITDKPVTSAGYMRAEVRSNVRLFASTCPHCFAHIAVAPRLETLAIVENAHHCLLQVQKQSDVRAKDRNDAGN